MNQFKICVPAWKQIVPSDILFQGILFFLMVFILNACDTTNREIPTISLEQALQHQTTIKLSQLASKVEYVTLKSPINLNSKSVPNRVIVRNQAIYVKSGYWQKIFVFDRAGNFITSVGDIGNRDDELSNITNSHWDVSPDGSKIIVYSKLHLVLYNLRTGLNQGISVPEKINQFYFLDNQLIVILQESQGLKEEDRGLFVYNSSLKLIDHVPLTRSLKTFNRMANVDKVLSPSNNRILYARSDQDTLFELSSKIEIKPLCYLDFGLYNDLGENKKDYTKYCYLVSCSETRKYLILNLFGRTGQNDQGYSEDILFYKKPDKFIFPRRNKQLNVEYQQNLITINDDLDGLGYYNSINITNDTEAKLFSKSSIENQLRDNLISNFNMPDSMYAVQLGEVLDCANENDLILRIVYYDKDTNRSNRKKPKWMTEGEIPLVKEGEVRSNHEWEGASFAAGITYDPNDDSFWISRFDEDLMEHRGRDGNILPGSFNVPKEFGIEGLTFNPHENSFWLVDIMADSAHHFSKGGENLNQSFKINLKGKGEPLGVAYDYSDSTLWILDHVDLKILHYTTDGINLTDNIDLLKIGCNHVRGLSYEPSDNSLWVLNVFPNRLVHVSKNGELSTGSFYFDPSYGLPDGVVLDTKTNNFWITDYSRFR